MSRVHVQSKGRKHFALQQMKGGNCPVCKAPPLRACREKNVLFPLTTVHVERVQQLGHNAR